MNQSKCARVVRAEIGLLHNAIDSIVSIVEIINQFLCPLKPKKKSQKAHTFPLGGHHGQELL